MYIFINLHMKEISQTFNLPVPMSLGILVNHKIKSKVSI